MLDLDTDFEAQNTNENILVSTCNGFAQVCELRQST